MTGAFQAAVVRCSNLELTMEEKSQKNDVVKESDSIIGLGSALRLGVVLAICGTIWWGATLTSDVNTIKGSLVRLNALDSLNAKIEALASRVDLMERRGSEPMLQLQKTLDKLATDLQVHILSTDARNRGSAAVNRTTPTNTP